MSLTVDQIVDRAGGHLNDVAHVRWSAADLAKYVSDGQRRVVLLLPSAYTETKTVTLSLTTQQSLPTGYNRLLEVVRNSVDSISGAGRVIPGFVPRAVLDVENINWHTTPLGTYVECVVYEPDSDTRTFYVYPKPKTAGMKIDVVLSKDPAEVGVGGTLVIDAMYHEPLIDYVMMRAIARDSESGNNDERVRFHAGAFLQGIGVRGAPSAAQ